MATATRRDRDEIQARLRRVEGQIRGIQRMIDEERDCESIVTQLMAARAALDRASLLIVSRHLQRCLTDAAAKSDQGQLDRIIEFLLKFSPPSSEGASPDAEDKSPADSEAS